MSDVAYYEWVKMGVPAKKQSYYDGIPAYIPIAQNASMRIYAFRRVIDNEPLPYHLEKCTDYEVEKLEKRRKGNSGD